MLDHRREADDLPDLHSFIRGIEADYDAVCNGLNLTHNSGAVSRLEKTGARPW
jgi:hypothetical protein